MIQLILTKRSGSASVLFALSLGLFIAIGTGVGVANDTSSSSVKHITLSSDQLQVVQNGVQQMVETTQAELSQTTATTHSGGPGIHVCGYVSYKDKTGADQSLPFYVELRDKAGQAVAERGQVANDASKLSKVNFVCRKNKGE